MPSAIAPRKVVTSESRLHGNGVNGSVVRIRETGEDPRIAGIGILDEQLRYVEVNETLAGINGLSIEGHLGKTVSEVIPSLAPHVETMAQRILRTGQPELNFELDGEIPAYPGEIRHWMVSMVPVTADDGKPRGIGMLVVDVSDKGGRSAALATDHHIESNGANGDSQSVQLNNRIKILKEVSVALSAAAEVLEHTRSAELYHTLDLENGIDFNDEVRRFEINLIQRALKESAGNQKKAAGLLHLKHTTLHTKIKRYDISTSH